MATGRLFAIIMSMSVEDQNHIIVGFVADLMFQSKIEPVAERAAYRLVWIERAQDIGNFDPRYQPDELGDHLEGPGAVLIDRITSLDTALMIFDLSNPGIPWRKWIALLKSNPATRRIPLICYGSHLDAEALKAASAAGANLVTARSNFAKDPLKLIQQTIRDRNMTALAQACEAELLPAGVHGLELFNRGEYFEAHELLEEAWKEDSSPGRDLYQAILQVAVAYLQIERGNYAGAIKMFWRLRQWIDPLPDTCRGVNIGRLREDSQRVYKVLIELGDQRVQAFDRSLFRPVDYQP